MTRQVKVGLFVILGLSLMMISVFLIGDVRGLWQRKMAYRTAFQDVAGLKPGAPVRMGGLDIGSVTAVDHSHDPSDARVYVSFAISTKETVRIRADSVAHVSNKGLLGDKMIELTAGTPAAPPQNPDVLLLSDEPSDVFSMANKVAAATEKTIEQLGPLTRALGDPQLAEDIKGTMSGVHALLDATVHGDGTVHRLFFDHREADELSQLLARLDGASTRLDAILADTEDATAHLRQGPGIAHALLYDGEISQNAGGAIAELHEDLKAIREGNGLAHALLYGDTSSQHVMSNVNAMSDDLRAIIGDVRHGKGTLGALLVDPTIYEDLKSAIGNVERNEVLRALVRYSIKADDAHPPPRVERSAP
jgi:phospholipid/cholesterol/gamma-HCH transport system substrate-binding protein